MRNFIRISLIFFFLSLKFFLVMQIRNPLKTVKLQFDESEGICGRLERNNMWEVGRE